MSVRKNGYRGPLMDGSYREKLEELAVLLGTNARGACEAAIDLALQGGNVSQKSSMVIPAGSIVYTGISADGPCGDSTVLEHDLPVQRVLRHARMVPKDGQNVTEGWWVQSSMTVFAEVE